MAESSVASIQRKQFGLVASTLVAMGCTILALSPVAYTAYRHRSPRIATVDLQKLVEEDQQRSIAALAKSADGVASDEQRSAYLKNTTAFAHKLEVAIDLAAQQCRCVIVNKAAVLGGEAMDYTESIRQRLAAP